MKRLTELVQDYLLTTRGGRGHLASNVGISEHTVDRIRDGKSVWPTTAYEVALFFAAFNSQKGRKGRGKAVANPKQIAEAKAIAKEYVGMEE